MIVAVGMFFLRRSAGAGGRWLLVANRIMRAAATNQLSTRLGGGGGVGVRFGWPALGLLPPRLAFGGSDVAGSTL